MEQPSRETEGIVEETLPKGLFLIRLDDGTRVRAGLTMEAKRFTVSLIPGQRVRVRVSPHDPKRGRITAKI
jgi:translation initiation factor IF-1